MLKRLTAIMLVMILVLSCAAAGEAASVLRLKKGSRGPAVKTLQTALKEQGYYSGKIDGVFGKMTLGAVREFQRKNGLVADGIAGPLTQAKLYGSQKAQTSGTVTSQLTETEPDPLQQTDAGNELTVPESAVSYMQRIARNSGAVCGTVVLSKNGKNFLTWSFGGVDENTCFRIASVTKWVTAIGLMTLYDDGKLDLDKDIGSYLGFKVRNPAYPDAPITARMLLSHTSSLSPEASNYHPDWARIGRKGYDPIFDETVRPGTKYAYADYNGALFGCLIEAISKQSVQNYLNQKVFRPLGLTAAYSPVFLPAGTVCRDLLKSNGKVEISVQKDRNRTYNNKADPKGNNGYTVGKLYINTASMTKLAQMMYNEGELHGIRILKASTVRLMESDQKILAESPYGLSTVRLEQFDRGTWYGHQGRYSGLSSNVYYQRETGITMALIMDGYDYQLKDNIVMPAYSILTNMQKIEELCFGTDDGNN